MTVWGPGGREIFGGTSRPITRPSMVTSAQGFTLRTRVPGASTAVAGTPESGKEPICAPEAVFVGDGAGMVGGGTSVCSGTGLVAEGSARVGAVSTRSEGVTRAEASAVGANRVT